MYADTITDSIQQAIQETNRRRVIQSAYNEAHGIIPESIQKGIPAALYEISEADYYTVPIAAERTAEYLPKGELSAIIKDMEKEMRAAAKSLEFERAAELRDKIKELKELDLGVR
jgi:excinuclease ABC subunit B